METKPTPHTQGEELPTTERICAECGRKLLPQDSRFAPQCSRKDCYPTPTQNTNQPSEGFDMRFFADREKRLLEAGNELADRALYTTREYDGLHRLGSAVAHWVDVVSKLNIPTANQPSEGWEKEFENDLRYHLHNCFSDEATLGYRTRLRIAIETIMFHVSDLLATARREEREKLYLTWDIEDTNGVLLFNRMNDNGVTEILGEIDFSKHSSGMFRLSDLLTQKKGT